MANIQSITLERVPGPVISDLFCIYPRRQHRVGRIFSGVYVYFCFTVMFFYHTISEKPMQLGSQNLTRTCSTMSTNS